MNSKKITSGVSLLNTIEKLCKTLADLLDTPFLKYASICELNYMFMDVMDYIYCLTECCADEIRFIIGDKELLALRELKRALHETRHLYYYGKREHYWMRCGGDCYKDNCTCSSSQRCDDCEIRVAIGYCEEPIETAYELLTNAVKNIQKDVAA